MRLFILTCSLALLAACNTVEGVKQDAYKADQAIQHTVKKLPK